MGCEGCLLTEKEKQQAIKTAEKNAKDYAVNIKKLVVLYWVNEITIGYMEAEAAKAAGEQPVKYISPLRPDANGGVH